MPKFNLGNIVARVVFGESWRERNNTEYLELLPQGHSRRALDDDDDDGSSIISVSTTATADDLPGTGRIFDTLIYQPMGRGIETLAMRIERLAMRISIASLPPARIAQYIEAYGTGLYPAFDDSRTTRDAIADICSDRWNGSTVVAGMKGLLKQTQSNSISTSASALAALIRVSFGYRRRETYPNVSLIEPIIHLETLVRSHPDKKWFLLLVKLARETLVAVRVPLSQKSFDPVLGKEVRQLRPSLKTAQNQRQRLIHALEVYRLFGLDSLDETIGEACALCAEVVSTCIDKFARGDAYMHILETVYFTVIFILRSIHELSHLARDRLFRMVVQTVSCWIDAIVYQCLSACASTRYHRRFNMDLLKVSIAFRSLILVDIVDRDTGYPILPESVNRVRNALLKEDIVPRRYREATKWVDDAPPIKSLIDAAKQRTWRLIRSFDALRMEVLGCALRTNISTLEFEINPDPHWFSVSDFGDEWWKCWRSTLGRAQRIQAQENEFTKEFREARTIRLSVDLIYPKRWAKYQLHRLSRHKWGQLLRSSMDWEWDLGTCMKSLFKIDEQIRVGPSQTASASSTAIGVATRREWTLKISTVEAQERLPKEVQVTYKTKTGETRFMSFVPAFPGPGGHTNSEATSSVSSADESLDPLAAQDLGYGKGSSWGNPETEDAGSSSSDDEQFLDREIIVFGELVDDLDGK